MRWVFLKRPVEAKYLINSRRQKLSKKEPNIQEVLLESKYHNPLLGPIAIKTLILIRINLLANVDSLISFLSFFLIWKNNLEIRNSSWFALINGIAVDPSAALL